MSIKKYKNITYGIIVVMKFQNLRLKSDNAKVKQGTNQGELFKFIDVIFFSVVCACA